MNWRVIWGVLKEAFTKWLNDKAPRLGAALAYYTVFSIAPLLIIVVAIAGFVFGSEAAQGHIVNEIQGLVGTESAVMIQSMIEKFNQPTNGILATVIGIATILFGATGLFGELQDALNTVWAVVPKPGRGLWFALKSRFASFTMILGIGFLLLVSLIISAAVAALGAFMGGSLPISEPLLHLINYFISFGVTTLLFAMIYKVLPDVQIQWNDVWTGAVVTALLFNIGKFLIGLYLGKSTITSAYGAAGSLVVMLLWVYYSAQILLFGAEFTQVYANRFGSRILPSENAMFLADQQLIKDGMATTRPVGREHARSPRSSA